MKRDEKIKGNCSRCAVLICCDVVCVCAGEARLGGSCLGFRWIPALVPLQRSNKDGTEWKTTFGNWNSKKQPFSCVRKWTELCLMQMSLRSSHKQGKPKGPVYTWRSNHKWTAPSMSDHTWYNNCPVSIIPTGWVQFVKTHLNSSFVVGSHTCFFWLHVPLSSCHAPSGSFPGF